MRCPTDGPDAKTPIALESTRLNRVVGCFSFSNRVTANSLDETFKVPSAALQRARCVAIRRRLTVHQYGVSPSSSCACGNLTYSCNEASPLVPSAIVLN